VQGLSNVRVAFPTISRFRGINPQTPSLSFPRPRQSSRHPNVSLTASLALCCFVDACIVLIRNETPHHMSEEVPNFALAGLTRFSPLLTEIMG